MRATKELTPIARFGSVESGFVSIKTILIVAIIGMALSLAAKAGPAYYEFTLLKDLADQVVTEHAKKKIRKVKFLIQFEMDRNNIDLPYDDAFEITKTPDGYRVIIDYQIPLDFSIGGQAFTIERFKELDFFYEVES